MHEEIIEQRFQAVIRGLCERWKSFDFHRQFRAKDSSLLVEPHLNRVGSVAGLADSLIQDLESIGAVAAIKLRLQTGSDADARWIPYVQYRRRLHAASGNVHD